MKGLIFNLDVGTLLGYELGAPIPVEFNKSHYTQPERGFAINVLANCITSLFVCFRNGYENYKAFEGSVIVNQTKYTIYSNTTFEEVVSILGKPKDTWNDGVEKCAEFEKNKLNIEVIWHVDGGLTLDYISVESAEGIRSQV